MRKNVPKNTIIILFKIYNYYYFRSYNNIFYSFSKKFSCDILFKKKGEIILVKLSGVKSKKKASIISESYEQWRNYTKESKDNFFIMPSGIKKYLPFFSGKAMNLYLFYCLNSDNRTGESWYSTKTCAKHLNVTERTINKWNEVLEAIGLIKRTSNNKTSKSTFLLPISNFIVKIDDMKSPQYVSSYYESNYQQDIDGELVGVINIFQWRKDLEKKTYTVPFNITCLMFERSYSSHDINTTVRKFILIKDGIEQELKTNNNDIKDDVYLIDKGDTIRKIFREAKTNLPLEVITSNIAVSSRFNLTSENNKEVMELLEAICEERTSLKEMTVIE